MDVTPISLAREYPGIADLMERAALLSTGPSLRLPLAEILTESGDSEASGGNAQEQAEREQIVRALRESNWVVGVLVERQLAWASRGRRSPTRCRSWGSLGRRTDGGLASASNLCFLMSRPE
jgi:hypothetical protein